MPVGMGISTRRKIWIRKIDDDVGCVMARLGEEVLEMERVSSSARARSRLTLGATTYGSSANASSNCWACGPGGPGSHEGVLLLCADVRPESTILWATRTLPVYLLPRPNSRNVVSVMAVMVAALIRLVKTI